MNFTLATEDCPHEGCEGSVCGLFDYEIEDADQHEVRLLMTCHECGQQWNEYYNHRATHIPEGMNA